MIHRFDDGFEPLPAPRSAAHGARSRFACIAML
jgi:hypothetical protein